MDVNNSTVEIGDVKIKVEPLDEYDKNYNQGYQYQPMGHEEFITDDIPAEEEAYIPVPLKLVKNSSYGSIQIQVEPCSIKSEPFDRLGMEVEQPQIQPCSVKSEPYDPLGMEVQQPQSITHQKPDQNPGYNSAHSTKILQKEVKKLKLNINTIESIREKLRIAFMKSKDDKSTGSTSVKLVQICSSSATENSNKVGKGSLSTEVQYINELRRSKKMNAKEYHSLKKNMEVHKSTDQYKEFVKSEACKKPVAETVNNVNNDQIKDRHFDIDGKETSNIDCKKEDGIVVIYTCCQCNTNFKDKYNLRMHMAVHGWEISVDGDEGKECMIRNNRTNKNTNDNSEKIGHICQECGKIFKTLGNLNRHIVIHSGEKRYECEMCHKRFTEKSSRNRHILIHRNENTFICNFCKKPFSRKESLATHIGIHIIERSYKCSWCNKHLNRYSRLRDHLRIHTKEKPFKCPFCEKCFCQKSNLTSHMIIHTKEKPFQCSVCNKCFNKKTNLRIHMRIHTKEKPFQCSTCEKMFCHKSNLREHMVIHNKHKPFICNVCEKGFSLINGLKSHMKTHTLEKPFRCPYCEKCFYQNSHLRAHQRIHTREKPFKCATCKKGFSQSSQLRRHERIHGKGKLLKCNFCKKNFRHKNELGTHMAVHIKE